jgi:hypothetical protein
MEQSARIKTWSDSGDRCSVSRNIAMRGWQQFKDTYAAKITA